MALIIMYKFLNDQGGQIDDALLQLLKTLNEAEKTEFAKKGKEFSDELSKTARQAAKKISEQGEQLSQTKVYRTVSEVGYGLIAGKHSPTLSSISSLLFLPHFLHPSSTVLLTSLVHQVFLSVAVDLCLCCVDVAMVSFIFLVSLLLLFQQLVVNDAVFLNSRLSICWPALLFIVSSSRLHVCLC